MLIIGLFVASSLLLPDFDIPDWWLPLAIVLMSIDLGLRFVRWLRAKLGKFRDDAAPDSLPAPPAD